MANDVVINASKWVKLVKENPQEAKVTATWTSWVNNHQTLAGRTDHFHVLWGYNLGGPNHFDYVDITDINHPTSEYTYPANAKKVWIQIQPIAKTHTVNKKEVEWYVGAWGDGKAVPDLMEAPETPSVPSIFQDGNVFTIRVDNLDPDQGIYKHVVEFELYKGSAQSAKLYQRKKIEVKYRAAEFKTEVGNDDVYKVRCRLTRYPPSDDAYRTSIVSSEWTNFSQEYASPMSKPSKISKCQSASENSVYLKWTAVKTATKYVIEYTTNKEWFDTAGGQVQTAEVDKDPATGNLPNEKTIVGLEYSHDANNTYYFRVKAVKNDPTTSNEVSSGWSPIASTIIGKRPEPPTTWSSTTTAMVGEPLFLYWVHNAVDNSSETYAQIKFDIDGTVTTETIKNESTGDDKDKTKSWAFNTSSLSAGGVIKWMVRTKGAINEWSDYSIQREINVYAKPVVTSRILDSSGNVTTTINSFPFIVNASVSAGSQRPIGYSVTVTSDQDYEDIDDVGNSVTINKNQEIYSKYFNVSDENESGDLVLELTPGDINLKSSMQYTVTIIASMDSGLTGSDTTSFDVIWDESIPQPTAGVGVNKEDYSAYVNPICYGSYIQEHKDYSSDFNYKQAITDDLNVGDVLISDEPHTSDWSSIKIHCLEGDVFNLSGRGGSSVRLWCFIDYTYEVKAISGTNETAEDLELIAPSDGYLIVNANENDGYTLVGDVSYLDESVTDDDIVLSVYRREYDGGFVELARDMPNREGVYVTDPHPALDYARYRIVAKRKSTGAMSFSDIPSYYFGEKAIIIQWNDVWQNFETESPDALYDSPFSGSLLRLPYNVDVSEKTNIDVSLIEYIGREHPVSYYGTQTGYTATWSVEIDKKDTETLYALRRLAKWTGDVYVREPSGSGYWANIKVSFSQTHLQLTIPVTMEITRVEGGV